MKKPIFFILILVLSLLEATILNSFKLLGVKPDLLLISVVIAGLIFDLKWGFIFAILAGILKDSLAAGPFGINTLLFSLWVFLIVNLSRKITLDINLVRIILVFIVAVSHNLVKKMIFFILGLSSASIGMFIYITFMESLYTAAILPVLFRFIESAFYPVTIE